MTTKVLKYLVLLAIVLLIVAISSFWVSEPSFKDGDVVLELDGPTQVSSGDEVTYKLKYENKNRSTLHALDLSFFYPEGSTVVVNGKIQTDYVEDIKIDELAPGQKGEKEFTSYLIGERGNIKVAKATLTFKAGNLTSFFEKTANFSTTIVTTPILLTLSAPPSVTSNETVQYVLDYRNESGEDAVDLWFEFDYPEGFIPKQFNPSPNSGNNIWVIKSLKKGQGGRISIGGILNGQEGENKIISAKLKRKVGGEYVDYQKVSTATAISNPVLNLDVSVNSSYDYSASLGDRLNYTIKYKNNSNFTFSGMNLSAKLEGEMFDFSSLDTRGGLFNDSAKTINWDSSSIYDFSNFLPNTENKINFSISLKSFLPSATGSSNNNFVKIAVKLGTQNVPSGFSGDEVSTSSSLVTKIQNQPTFNQFIYYNDPDFGSTGPLPLRVGEETYFTVHWQLSNPSNDAKNIKITGKLPSGVEWANQVRSTGGQPSPTFNSSSSEISWVLDRLPYGTGVFTPKYEGSFRIKVKPTSNQKGNLVSLIENVQFTGASIFTEENFVVKKSNISSDNLTDRPHEGTVQ